MSQGRDRIIGFDRKIELPWLDTTAALCADRVSVAEIRARLHKSLDGTLAGDTARSARHKTITVLTRVWCTVPAELTPLRDEGLELLRSGEARDRLVLHWGMASATHPFFREVATVTGRLIGLQGHVSSDAILRRVRERRGQRKGLDRAVQRVLRTFVAWGALEDQILRGWFRPPREPLFPDEDISGWLLEALLWSDGGRQRPALSLARDPSLFPFNLADVAACLRRRTRIQYYQHGLDEQLVSIKGARPHSKRRS